VGHFYPRNRRRPALPYGGGSGPTGDAGQQRWSAQALAELLNHREYRLQDDPFACQLIQMVLADPDDLDAQQMLTECIHVHQLAFLGSGDVFWGNYPGPGRLVYPPGFLPLGLMPTGDALGLVLDQLNGNVLWLGPTKSGKTTLLSLLLAQAPLLGNARIVVFSKKERELSDLALLREIRHLVTVLRLEDLVLSYFQPPPGVSELAWVTESVRILAQSYARYSAQKLVGEKVKELLARHPDGAYPTLGQLLEALDRFKPRFGLREAAYRESASWMITDLLNSTGNIWSYASSTFLDYLYSGPGLCIIEAGALPQEHLTFLATYFMRWLYLQRVSAGKGAGGLVVFVLEDATPAVHVQRDRESPGGIAPISECAYMGQRLGMGMICVVHTLSSTSEIIRQNVGAFVVCGLPSEDPRLICDTLMVTPEQAEKIQILHRGEFVLRNGALWDRALYGVYQKPQIPGPISESDQQEMAGRFLKNVEARAPVPFDAFGPGPATHGADPNEDATRKELPPEQIQMLVIIASGLPKTAGKVYEAMGIGRAQGVKIAKVLESVGAIAAHRFSTGRIGGQLAFFEVLDHGRTILQARGISKPAPLTNGGFEHELAAQLLKAEAIRSDFAIQFEVDLGGLRVDAVMTNKKTGQRIYCQIGASKPGHEVDSIEKFFSLPASQNAKFVLVARDVTFVKEVKKVFRTRKIEDAIVKQVHLRVIADLVKE
jgi:hypothetical protein